MTKEIINPYKDKSTEELQRLLNISLVSEHPNDVYTQLIIKELLARGIKKEDIEGKTDKAKEKVEKAFEILNLDDFIEKLEKAELGPEGQSKNRNANLRGRDRIFNEERQKAWEKEPKVSKVPKKGYYKVEGIDSMEYHREEKPHAEYSHK